MLGVLQGATELFPVSSLGHTVLFPTPVRLGQHRRLAVAARVTVAGVRGDAARRERRRTADLLLAGLGRDHQGVLRDAGKRRIETPTERLAWLIILATIPVGILGLVLEHTVRVALAKPLSASIFLVVNGLILLWAERFRKRAEVRELAAREGMKRDGGRRLDTLEFREAGLIGVAQSTALIAGISRDGMVMSTGLVRGLDNSDAARFAFLLATPPILARWVYKLGDLTGPLGAACAALR